MPDPWGPDQGIHQLLVRFPHAVWLLLGLVGSLWAWPLWRQDRPVLERVLIPLALLAVTLAVLLPYGLWVRPFHAMPYLLAWSILGFVLLLAHLLRTESEWSWTLLGLLVTCPLLVVWIGIFDGHLLYHVAVPAGLGIGAAGVWILNSGRKPAWWAIPCLISCYFIAENDWNSAALGQLVTPGGSALVKSLISCGLIAIMAVASLMSAGTDRYRRLAWACLLFAACHTAHDDPESVGATALPALALGISAAEATFTLRQNTRDLILCSCACLLFAGLRCTADPLGPYASERDAFLFLRSLERRASDLSPLSRPVLALTGHVPIPPGRFGAYVQHLSAGSYWESASKEYVVFELRKTYPTNLEDCLPIAHIRCSHLENKFVEVDGAYDKNGVLQPDKKDLVFKWTWPDPSATSDIEFTFHWIGVNRDGTTQLHRSRRLGPDVLVEDKDHITWRPSIRPQDSDSRELLAEEGDLTALGTTMWCWITYRTHNDDRALELDEWGIPIQSGFHPQRLRIGSK